MRNQVGSARYAQIMHSWPSPAIPSLRDAGLGAGPAVRLYDRRSGTIRTIDPQDEARLYVCGITPYDATHMGHAATYLAFDLLHRVWLDRGLDVNYTQNITDVDDPLLERADATGEDWRELAERETQLFREDMAHLAVIPPRHYVGAVESIDLVLKLIDQLAAKNVTYRVDDDLYFDVHSDPDFGTVSGLDQESMLEIFGERGGDPDRAGKRHRLDCLLWQAQRPGEPSWDSPYGPGRPGWHIECSAIALEHLGTQFDVQGGGSDLVFPHHEMSAAEAQVATDEPFARHFMHTAMVGYDGHKMSKSRGNLVLVSQLREDGHDPAAIRLALLAHHYRTDWEWTDSDLHVAFERLGRWRAAIGRETGPVVDELLVGVRRSLTEDLDAPAALALIDSWANTVGDDPAAPGQAAKIIDALLGIDLVG